MSGARRAVGNGREQEAPRVSVVIVNWNTRKLLDQTLTTLYERTMGVVFETIVVDNGSTDGSVEMLRESWPQVRAVELDRNVGFAVANNVGFQVARGRYVLMLNSDTIVLRSTLPGLVEVLDREPGVGCVGARHLNGDGTLQRSIDAAPALLNDFFFNTELHRLPVFHGFLVARFPWWGPHDEACTPGWVNGACMMVRRSVIEQIGGLDENIFIYAEEVDWCYRIWQAGWTVCFTPDAEVIHLGGRAMDNAATERIRLLYKGQLRFYHKHYAWPKTVAYRSIVVGIASVRLVLIVGLATLIRLGHEPSQWLWEFVTQERIRTGAAPMLRAWWSILRMALQPVASATGAPRVTAS